MLDFLDVGEVPDRVGLGVRLLRAALGKVIPPGRKPPRYARFVPPDWRQHSDTRRDVEDLVAIVGQAGGQLQAERFRFEWRPGTPIAAAAGRLAFRPATDDDELTELMTLVLAGTLDANSCEELTRMPARDQAAGHFRDMAGYRSPRQWWQVATLPSGEPAGFVIPAHNNYGPIIAYIGVLPAHRGNGYIGEILAEGTRILAAHGAHRIRAATDLANVPMASAFARAGWVAFEHSIVMIWP